MRKKLIGFNIVLGILAVVVLCGSVQVANGTSADEERLRALRVDMQRIQQAVRYLENKEYAQFVSSLDKDLNEIKIAVAEIVSQQQSPKHLSDLTFQLETQTRVLLPEHAYPIRSLRLTVKLHASSFTVLESYLQSLKESVSPWPFEVRACDIHRLVVSKIMANCFVDIHYWEET